MIHSIFRYVLLFLLAFSVVPAGAEINPPNPPEPPAGIVSYPLTVTCSPANAAYCSGSGRYTVGQKVWINTSAKAGYVFDHWTLNGQPYEAGGMQFEFTTLGARTQLVAHYRYEPANPAEPTPSNQVRLFLSTSPDGVASFNRTSGERVLVGTELNLYVYPNQGYKFQGWYSGGVLIGESQSLHYTMPADVTTLVAKFVYNPDVPIEPVSPSEQPDVDLTPNEDVVGDINGDEDLDIYDLRYLVKIVLGQQDEIEAADVNANGRISISDVTALVRLLKSKK